MLIEPAKRATALELTLIQTIAAAARSAGFLRFS